MLWLYFISFGIIEPILVILKIEYRLSQRLGAYAASQATVLHMKRLNQPSLRCSWFCVFFVSKGNLFSTFILIQMSVKYLYIVFYTIEWN